MPFNGSPGTTFGKTFSGDVISLTDLDPLPGNYLASSGSIQFTIAAQDGSIELSSIRITINGSTGFTGSTDTFGPYFSALSTYQPEPSVDGYSFVFERTGGFVDEDVVIEVYAETNNGTKTTTSYSLTTISLISYPDLPLELPLHGIKISSFSGESQEGLLGGAAGQVFFSPGLENADVNVQLDVDDIEVKTYSLEMYNKKQVGNERPFVWGPPFAIVPPAYTFPPTVSTDYLPTLNDGNYVFVKTTDATVRGVLHDTILVEDVFIFY